MAYKYTAPAKETNPAKRKPIMIATSIPTLELDVEEADDAVAVVWNVGKIATQ